MSATSDPASTPCRVCGAYWLCGCTAWKTAPPPSIRPDRKPHALTVDPKRRDPERKPRHLRDTLGESARRYDAKERIYNVHRSPYDDDDRLFGPRRSAQQTA